MYLRQHGSHVSPQEPTPLPERPEPPLAVRGLYTMENILH